MALKIINIPIAAFLVVLLSKNNIVEGVIGINWGRQSAQRLVPSIVVDLLLQNGIPEVRIYSHATDVLDAFANSGIGVSTALMDPVHITSLDAAKEWVRDKVQAYPKAKISRIYVGMHPFRFGMLNKTILNTTLEATILLQNALNEMGYGKHTKTTISSPEQILKANSTKPSDAEFREEIKEEMSTFLSFLEENNSPFVIDLFPLSVIQFYRLPQEFAYIDNQSTFVVPDNVTGHVYTNVFDLVYDSFVWAIIKAGSPNLKIMVGQIGWPTDGFPGSNVSKAERFYKKFLPYVASNKGTPMRPGAPIDIFVHELKDENRMPAYFPPARHWGIYRSNGEPKFKIDLTGQGRDIFPTKAVGVTRMPGRWCMYNGGGDMETILRNYEDACEAGDCTPLLRGGSCDHLDFGHNISYAFNMYFQLHFQAETACNFEGLGMVITHDPSHDGCVFPLDVVRGRQDQLISPNSGCKLVHEVLYLLLLLFIFLSML